MHIAIFASSNAKFWPMQMRGPQPNGRKAPGSLDDLEIPSANLSGLNSCASLPYQAWTHARRFPKYLGHGEW
jgi:hypothetical protein